MSIVWTLYKLSRDGSSSKVTDLRIGSTTFGRQVENTVQCMSVLSSRYHCIITLKNDGSIFIKDLKSLNGTFIGEQKLLPNREISLSSGDVIGIGVEMNDYSSDPNSCIYRLDKKLLSEDELAEYDNSTKVPVKLAESSDLQCPESRNVINKESIIVTSPKIETIRLDSSDEEENAEEIKKSFTHTNVSDKLQNSFVKIKLEINDLNNRNSKNVIQKENNPTISKPDIEIKAAQFDQNEKNISETLVSEQNTTSIGNSIQVSNQTESYNKRQRKQFVPAEESTSLLSDDVSAQNKNKNLVHKENQNYLCKSSGESQIEQFEPPEISTLITSIHTNSGEIHHLQNELAKKPATLVEPHNFSIENNIQKNITYKDSKNSNITCYKTNDESQAEPFKKGEENKSLSNENNCQKAFHKFSNDLLNNGDAKISNNSNLSNDITLDRWRENVEEQPSPTIGFNTLKNLNVNKSKLSVSNDDSLNNKTISNQQCDKEDILPKRKESKNEMTQNVSILEPSCSKNDISIKKCSENNSSYMLNHGLNVLENPTEEVLCNISTENVSKSKLLQNGNKPIHSTYEEILIQDYKSLEYKNTGKEARIKNHIRGKDEVTETEIPNPKDIKVMSVKMSEVDNKTQNMSMKRLSTEPLDSSENNIYNFQGVKKQKEEPFAISTNNTISIEKDIDSRSYNLSPSGSLGAHGKNEQKIKSEQESFGTRFTSNNINDIIVVEDEVENGDLPFSQMFDMPNSNNKADSFTVDDLNYDVVLIDDDDDENNDELPCSQMFDMKYESSPEQFNNCPVDLDNEFIEISDEDSNDPETDEWFQKLSQGCEEQNLCYDDIKDENSDAMPSTNKIEIRNKGHHDEHCSITTYENSRSSPSYICNDTDKESKLTKTSSGTALILDESIGITLVDSKSVDKNMEKYKDDAESSEQQLLQKIPSGKKRKLSESSESEKEDNSCREVENFFDLRESPVANKPLSNNKRKLQELYEKDLNQKSFKDIKGKHEGIISSKKKTAKKPENKLNNEPYKEINMKRIKCTLPEYDLVDTACSKSGEVMNEKSFDNRKNNFSEFVKDKPTAESINISKLNSNSTKIDQSSNEIITNLKGIDVTYDSIGDEKNEAVVSDKEINCKTKLETLPKVSFESTSHGISTKSKTKFNKHSKSKTQSTDETHLSHSSDVEDLEKCNTKEHILDTFHKYSDENTSETSNDSLTSEWKAARDIVLKITEQKIASANILQEKDIFVNKENNYTHTDINLGNNNDFNTNKINELVFDDIEEQIKPNTISKTSNTDINATNKIVPHSQKIYKSKEIKPLLEDDSKNSLAVSKDVKLDEVNKKIHAAHKKKIVPIIEAKTLPTRRKQPTGSEPRLRKEALITGTPSEKWLSKEQTEKGETALQQQPVSKSERKALRKEKLKGLTKNKEKQNSDILQEKTKTLTTAKNTTKVTSKSRNEIFVDNLFAQDKDTDKVVVTNDKNISKDNERKLLSSFKIPRRSSNSEDHANFDLKTSDGGSSKNSSFKPSLHMNMSLKNNSSKSKLKQSETVCENKCSTINNESIECSSFIDQILTPNTVNNKQKTRVSRLPPKVVSGVENEEPPTIVLVPDNGNHQPLEHIACVKSIIKLPSTMYDVGKTRNKKKVHFNKANDKDSVIYVMLREYIVEGTRLMPVTKTVVKKDTPPPRRKPETPSVPYTNYLEETIYQICKWNTKWLEEKNSCKGEPPVCDGQKYHLNTEFINYNEYRRVVFPLLLYELWQSVAKQHDLMQNRFTNFYVEIRQLKSNPVKNLFLPPQKENEHRILSRLECQMLLERGNQRISPRQGDLLVLEITVITDSGPVIKRVFTYLFSSSIRSISSHRDVSSELKKKTPNASQVMDFTLIIREIPLQISTPQLTRICVLKNIRPELRAFDALDRLPSSPLLSQICQPKTNTSQLAPVDISTASHPTLVHLNLSQKTAVLNIAKACVSEENSIHFIHGPPGCGKSEVIISIILQMWFAYCKKEFRGKPQILLCAPSNAAIDDIFFRLMNIRQSLERMPKFNMVRIGRTDMAHKNVSSLTLDYLVEKELKKARDLREDDQQKYIEIKNLEAKKNQVNFQLENLGTRKDDLQYIKSLQRKLAETCERIKELESGKPINTADGLRKKKRDLEISLLEGANIIATTLSSCYNSQMEQAHFLRKFNFTCCIVDEATQCTEPETLIPLMLGISNLVLVGDPQQLPATVLSPLAKGYGLDRSLFARHQDWRKKESQVNTTLTSVCSRYHFLDTQYRMHPEIARWPSEFFYNNLIKSHQSLEARSASCPLLPYMIFSHDAQQSTQEECNYDEVKMVVNLVNSIVRSGLCDGLTIGIITPYNRQKDQIRNRFDFHEVSMVEVGTVDSYQGRERDIVIFSCVRTEGIGFMSGVERLNVALTRAKQCLIIIGNFSSLKDDRMWKSLINNARSRLVIKPVVNVNQDIFAEILKPGYPKQAV